MRGFSAAATMHHVTSNLLAILAGSSSLTTKEGHQKILDSMGIDGSTRSSVS